ncbi:MAG: hypothetical protein K2J38_06800 [Muribaculaceae bacterium]|nr:hypothetical protein [Muribaculaceae bacterium]
MKNDILRLPRLDSLDQMTDFEETALALRESSAGAGIELLNWPAAYPRKVPTMLHGAWTAAGLYLLFDVCTHSTVALHDKDQSMVSDDCCVEAFIQPVAGKEYFNIEANCIGAVSSSRRMDRQHSTRLTPDQLGLIEIYTTLPERETFGERDGECNWSVLMFVPWSLLEITPCSGTELRGNFYSCAGGAQTPYYQTLFPIESTRPDFHRPECFGKIILE